MQRSVFVQKIITAIIIVFFILGILLVAAMLTNPYGSQTLIEKPFSTSVDQTGSLIVKQQYPVAVTHNIFLQKFAALNKNTRFIFFVLFPERPFKGKEDEIIAAIHKKAFNPDRPYLISGAQFADIYVRNLGIFYNAVMDNRIQTTKEDWLNRQKIYLQGLAINLELLRLSGKEYTTFTPVVQTTYTASNIYTDPSDSLFGVLYAISAVKDEAFIHKLSPTETSPKYPLQTQKAAKILLKRYNSTLQKAVNDYQAYAIDNKTGLIKRHITLASARDGIKRESSFYDNVILWSTIKMARDLDIAVNCPTAYTKGETCDFQSWKEKVITTFWDEKSGIFLNDLSEESRNEKIFSGDAFIVIGSGFFDIRNAEDAKKLRKMISYVETNNLAKPFPLFYAKSDPITRLYGPVQKFATSYQGETIWSHWGMEYIKALILLHDQNPEYTKKAAGYLETYKNNIEKNGGYPELYDKQGNLYKTLFYRSILQTSWVINYEQTKLLLKNVSK